MLAAYCEVMNLAEAGMLVAVGFVPTLIALEGAERLEGVEKFRL
jgi:hypothetical protein